MAQSAKRHRKRKDGQPFNPTHPQRLLTRQRELQAVDMRIAGMRYEDIGPKLGMTKIGAYAMVERVLKRWNEELLEKAERLRQQQMERCRVMMRGLWPKIKKGDVKAVTAGLKVIERISKLQGLDAPVQISGTGTDGAITVEVFRRMVEAAESGTPTATLAALEEDENGGALASLEALRGELDGEPPLGGSNGNG